MKYKHTIIDLRNIFHVNGKDIFPDAVIILFKVKYNFLNSRLSDLVLPKTLYQIEKSKNDDLVD